MVIIEEILAGVVCSKVSIVLGEGEGRWKGEEDTSFFNPLDTCIIEAGINCAYWCGRGSGDNPWITRRC